MLARQLALIPDDPRCAGKMPAGRSALGAAATLIFLWASLR
jgi:hypothetical protein